MTDAAAANDAQPAAGQPTTEQPALSAAPTAPPGPAAAPTAGADEHPEIAAGAAFAGGLALALLLKRFAR